MCSGYVHSTFSKPSWTLIPTSQTFSDWTCFIHFSLTLSNDNVPVTILSDCWNSEQASGWDVEFWGHGLGWCTIQALAWRDCRNTLKTCPAYSISGPRFYPWTSTSQRRVAVHSIAKFSDWIATAVKSVYVANRLFLLRQKPKEFPELHNLWRKTHSRKQLGCTGSVP
jgi:hypothetical protein